MAASVSLWGLASEPAEAQYLLEWMREMTRVIAAGSARCNHCWRYVSARHGDDMYGHISLERCGMHGAEALLRARLLCAQCAADPSA